MPVRWKSWRCVVEWRLVCEVRGWGKGDIVWGGFDVVGSGFRFRGSRLSWLPAVPCRLVSFQVEYRVKINIFKR